MLIVQVIRVRELIDQIVRWNDVHVLRGVPNVQRWDALQPLLSC
jgi:hypothetical protein